MGLGNPKLALWAVRQLAGRCRRLSIDRDSGEINNRALAVRYALEEQRLVSKQGQLRPRDGLMVGGVTLAIFCFVQQVSQKEQKCRRQSLVADDRRQASR